MELVDLVERPADLVKVDGLLWRPPAVLALARQSDYPNSHLVLLERVNRCRAMMVAAMTLFVAIGLESICCHWA